MNQKLNPILSNLLFNPSSYGLADIITKVNDGEVTADDLTTVLGRETCDQLLAQKTAQPSIPLLVSCDSPFEADDMNLVVFWGNSKSGRTSVIGSLLSIDGVEAVYSAATLASAANNKRVEALKKALSPGAPRLLPPFNGSACDVYYARYKKDGKTYCLQLVEASITMWPDVSRILNQTHRQIHIFCLDCRQDLERQVNTFKSIVSRLSAYLQKANGLYVLVTKSDLMKVPQAYLDGAAQTLVTSSRLWIILRNACKEALICNEQPVTCSVGDFKLRDYASPSLHYTTRLLNEYIVPKCVPQRGRLAKWLGSGSRTMTAVVAALVTALVSLGAYFALSAINPPPEQVVEPFDYTNYFMGEVEASLPKGVDYDKASEAYTQLRIDLDVERTLRDSKHNALLTPEAQRECDEKLSNAFAGILFPCLKEFFNSTSWSRDTVELSKFDEDLANLDLHQASLVADYQQSCQDYRQTLDDFHTLEQMLALSGCCTTNEQVDSVAEFSAQCDKWPFTNDNNLKDQINQAEDNAYSSCADYYRQRADDVKEQWESVRWDASRLLWWQSHGEVDRVKDSARSIANNAEGLLDRLNEKQAISLSDVMQKAKSDLEATKRRMESIYE